jgi:hypothetical protein
VPLKRKEKGKSHFHWNIHTFSEYGFTFYAYNTSTIIYRWTECLIYHHGILHSIVSDHEPHFTENDAAQETLSITLIISLILCCHLEPLA